jgi:hypothetical protein
MPETYSPQQSKVLLYVYSLRDMESRKHVGTFLLHTDTESASMLILIKGLTLKLEGESMQEFHKVWKYRY